MWGKIALAAAPSILGMFQNKPDMPAYSPNVELRDRSALVDQMLAQAMSPDPTLLKQASEITGGTLNRALASRGLGGGTIPATIMANAQNQLALDWASAQQAAQLQALQTALGFDLDQFNAEKSLYDAMYKSQLGGYQDTLARQAAAIQGLSGLAGSINNIIGQHETRKMIENAMNPANRPSGIYSSIPRMP